MFQVKRALLKIGDFLLKPMNVAFWTIVTTLFCILPQYKWKLDEEINTFVTVEALR